jgi:hypothetical protein
MQSCPMKNTEDPLEVMTVMPNFLIRVAPLLLFFLALVLSGCSSLNLSEGLKWTNSEDEPQIPNEIVDVWTNDILHHAGQSSKRGFGGRLMFHSRDIETPVKVEGSLTVYLFDDRGEDPLREDPIHKFIFPAEAFEKHYSESKLGHSYSFWLPIDDVGGVEKKLTVIARFEPKLGGKIMSKPSTHVLPGRPVDDQPTSPLVQRFEARGYTKKANGEVQQVAHIEPVTEQPAMEPPRKEGITTTTINLPPAFARQIGDGPPQSAFGVPIVPPAVSPGPEYVPSAAQVPAIQPAQASSGTQLTNSSLASRPPTRSGLSRFPARREALGRPVASRVRTQPYRATWPTALPSTPRAAPWNESQTTPSDAVPSTFQGPEREEW